MEIVAGEGVVPVLVEFLVVFGLFPLKFILVRPGPFSVWKGLLVLMCGKRTTTRLHPVLVNQVYRALRSKRCADITGEGKEGDERVV